MTGLNKIWKDKDITIATTCKIVIALVFTVVLMVVNPRLRKAERRRIDSLSRGAGEDGYGTARITRKSVIEEINATNPLIH